ncbi:peptide ABC transporter substrate-binding protein [Hazenella coriacea]|uniref:Periplasmic oligopeptide-binding protein OppA n=1 Tax=Hazenella coriacea TaxID=1179467 RepID=A0A4R3L9X9_9BACL|nr:peptide ABC transporter substrate-binding protein [Hazenella coriacea]TCS96911.1 oligopeptide transport system substrate-binding protein [Hazenella coriacea]
MSKRLRFSSLLAILLVAVLVLSACGGGSDSASNEQVLNMLEAQEPPGLDSAKTTDSVSFNILNNTMEGLYRIGQDGNPTLGIAAEEPQESEDKLTYTFKLRDAQWSDGKPVTAHDFEYAWKRALDPATASEYAYILYPVKNAEKYNTQNGTADEVGVKAKDEKTLEVTLESPIPYFKDLLGFPTYLPQRKDIVEKYGDKYSLEAGNLVYNGPFVLSEWKHNQNFVLKKNTGYWDVKTVKLEQINFDIVKDGPTGINLYTTNKVDVAPIPGEFVDKYKDHKEKINVEQSSSWYLEMNQTKPAFQNKKIRQAITLGIDRDKYVNEILKNGSIPATGLVPVDIKLNDTQKYRDVAKFDAVRFDPAEAKKLWAEGMKELNMDPNQAFELVGDDTTGAKRNLEYVKEQLRVNVGANVKITSVPFKERLQRGKDGKFDILLSGWGADFNDPMTYVDLFTTGNSFNRGKWSNPEFDALVKKSKNNANFEERGQDLIKAEKIFLEDYGVAPIYFRGLIFLEKPHVKGLVRHAIGPDYSYKWAYVEGKK